MQGESVYVAFILPLVAIVSFAFRVYFRDRMLNRSRGERIWSKIAGGKKLLWVLRLLQGYLFYGLPLLIITVVLMEVAFPREEAAEMSCFLFVPILLSVSEFILWRRAFSRLEDKAAGEKNPR